MRTRETITVRNPASGAVVGEVPMCAKQEVDEAVLRAHKAQKQWSALPFSERIECLKRLRCIMLRRQEEIIITIRAETAKTYVDAATEVVYACGACVYFTGHIPEPFALSKSETQLMLANKAVYSTHEPWPVVGMITPWNLPFTLTLGEAIPYLLMGSVVVLKPSEWTPLSALLAENLCTWAGMPEGVFQVLPGNSTTGALLAASGADAIAFTGSAKTGRMVGEVCGKSLKPFFPELGGKTPFLILEDTNSGDLERAIHCALWSAFANTGQYCKSTERLYVVRRHATRVIEALTELACSLRAQRDFGPMITPFQVEIVKNHIADAVAKGARILVDGADRSELGGQWFWPTVLSRVDHSMLVMREETFGPVLPIMVVEHDEEAIRLANDCAYGLNAVVFCSDTDRAIAVAHRLEAGTVTIRDALINYMAPSVPYGGVKESGWGRHHGVVGSPDYARQKTIFVHRFQFPFRKDLWWFPYTKRTEFLMRHLARWNRFFTYW